MDFPQNLDDDIGGPDPDEEIVDGSDADTTSEEVIDKLQVFGARLAQRRDEWVQARASQGHDKRWADDLDQYNGKDSTNRAAAQMMTSVEAGFPVTTANAKPMRSTVYVQVTRQKTNSLAARMGDIVLPTDERNFSISPTPVPTLPLAVLSPQSVMGDPGAGASPSGKATGPAGAQGDGMTASGAPPIGGPQPAASSAPGGAPGGPAGSAPPGSSGGPQTNPTPISAAAQKLLDDQAEAHKRAEAMQQKIEDCFDECDYNGEVRKVIFDAALFGAGVLKGPVVINRTKKAWTKKTDVMGRPMWALEIVTEMAPGSFRRDPRNIYPDPACGDNVQDGRGIFEVEKLTPKRVRDLAKQPAYIKDQLRTVLEEGPAIGKATQTVGEMDDRDTVSDEIYEHWTYWGEVDRDDLIAAGVDVPDDDLEVVSACVEMINSTVVRAYHNPLAAGALPYDIFPCERVPGSVWGYGVPYLMRAQQRVINAAWRMILDNAGVSSGPQIVVNPSVIQPADKSWQITARKVWYANDDVDDVKKAFATFEFNSHQAELQAIIEMADKLSDQETAVPMLTQGQQGSAPETVGGMQILMSSANVMLRRLVKQFDDYLTKPHVARYYDYLMEYSEDDDIKGDFNIVALGSSSLVVRDIANQGYRNLLALGTNPAYAPLIDLKKLFARSLKAEHIDPLDIMNTDAQIAQNQQIAAQNQQPDPRIVAAQARSKADEDRTAAQVQMNKDTLAAKEAMAKDETSIRMIELQMEKDIAMLQVSLKQGISIDQIKAELAAVAMRERVKQDMQAVQLQHEAAHQPPTPQAPAPATA